MNQTTPTFTPCSRKLAAEQVRVLIGCYRKGEAADPEVYISAVGAVLMAYPEDVVRYVTNPVYGLPGKTNWLPTVAEVKAACETEMKPRYDQLRMIRKQERQRQLLAAPQVTDEQRERAVARWENEIRPEISPRSDKPRGENREVLKGRLMEMAGMTPEQWDAIPNAVERDMWGKLKGPSL